MDMNAQTRNSLLTAMVCVALSSGTAWAATPELDLPAAQQQTAYQTQSDSQAVAEKAAELRDMPLRWQAVPTTKELERAAKPQPVIITADDIKAQRKAERRKLAAESVKGQAQGRTQSQPGHQAPGQVKPAPVMHPAAAVSQTAVASAKMEQPPQAKTVQQAQPKPLQPLQSKPVQPVQQVQPKPVQPLSATQSVKKQAEMPAGTSKPLQSVQPQQPLTQAKPVQVSHPAAMPVRPVQASQAVQQPGVMQAKPVQQPRPVQSVPQPSIMQVSSVQRQGRAADSEPGPLKQALQRLREKDNASGSRPQAAASGPVNAGTYNARPSAPAQQKPMPQIQTAQDTKRPLSQQPGTQAVAQPKPAVQPARRQDPAGQLPKPPAQIQVERPAEFANVSDEVVRHILAGEFAMMHQLRQDPSEPGVYKLTQILNQNTGLTHLQKIEYLIGFGRAINRSKLTEWQKSALIKSVVEAFE